MSEDPIEAIEQVADVIKEGVKFGGGNVISGWLHNATKTEIIEWLAGNVLSRVVNALERTREALDAKNVKRNCDRFNSGDVKKDAQDALEAYLESGCCGYRAVAEYLLSPIERKSHGH